MSSNDARPTRAGAFRTGAGLASAILLMNAVAYALVDVVAAYAMLLPGLPIAVVCGAGLGGVAWWIRARPGWMRLMILVAGPVAVSVWLGHSLLHAKTLAPRGLGPLLVFTAITTLAGIIILERRTRSC